MEKGIISGTMEQWQFQRKTVWFYYRCIVCVYDWLYSRPFFLATFPIAEPGLLTRQDCGPLSKQVSAVNEKWKTRRGTPADWFQNVGDEINRSVPFTPCTGPDSK